MTTRLAAVLAALSTLACGPGKSVATTADDDTSSDAATSESDTPGDGDPSETDDEPDETGDESLTFVPEFDYATCGVCDTFQQDCPEGEKCVPGPELGPGSCGPPSCLPLVGDKQPGEPCEVDGTADDCDASSWCYPAGLDIEGPAVCIEFCQGTSDDSHCSNPDEVCVWDRAGYGYVLGCRPRCDPLAPDVCMPGEACTIGWHDQPDFGCVIASAELGLGEPCSYNQECAAGLCLDAVDLPECAGDRCCASLCDLLAPECPVGTECAALELPDDPDSHVGVCSLG